MTDRTRELKKIIKELNEFDIHLKRASFEQTSCQYYGAMRELKGRQEMQDEISEIITKLKIAEMRLSEEGAKIDNEIRKRRLNFNKKEGEKSSLVYWYFEKLREEINAKFGDKK